MYIDRIDDTVGLNEVFCIVFSDSIETSVHKMPVKVGSFICLALLLTDSQLLAGPIFVGLGDLSGGTYSSEAFGISADGRSVVGRSNSGASEAFLWRDGPTGGIVGLGSLAGFSDARGISADGTVVVGRSTNSSGLNEAFRWTSNGGMAGLGDLAGGDFFSLARATSSDGSVIVGIGSSGVGPNPNGFEAMRWTESEGMIGLGDLSGGIFQSQAADVSSDGAVIVGTGTISGTRGLNDTVEGLEAFHWTESGGLLGLGDLAGGTNWSSASAVSSDGLVVVGRSISNLGTEAFQWNSADGMEGLGMLVGDDVSSAFDVSADGSVIVGTSANTSLSGPLNRRAFIWDDINGLESLQVVIESEGVDLTGWTLLDARGVSADGSVVVGTGINPTGQREAYIFDFSGKITPPPSTPSNLPSVVPEPSGLMLFGIGTLCVCIVWFRPIPTVP